MPIFKIKGAVQHYAWGGCDFIPDLLNEKFVNQPCAEYWMGAHTKASSTIDDKGITLDEFINKDRSSLLGKSVADRFGRLPFLFKVLDVSEMLSIQVHPTKIEAEKGFARENEKGIPITAPNRNYRDDNHKPEIMVALNDFWLLHGFKPSDKLKRTLNSIPELNHLASRFDKDGFKGLYQSVMVESPEQTTEVLKPLIDRIIPDFEAGLLDKSSSEYWAAKAYKTFSKGSNLDKGLYSIFFFNIVRAQAGEAIFQDAGVPHAYMEGQCIELMANSDNVLRGGLTPKHVDVPELLKHVIFDETIPNILSGEFQRDGIEKIYQSSAPDFELSKLIFDQSKQYETTTATLEILIVMDGKIQVQSNGENLILSRGEVFVATANTNYTITSQSAEVYKAKCPVTE